MTTFIINDQERELRYDVDGIDISGDFIGNTYHGMEQDEEGRYLASPEDFEWWQSIIAAHEKMDNAIAAYKALHDADQVDQVVEDWANGDYEAHPHQVEMGLVQTFGELE